MRKLLILICLLMAVVGRAQTIQYLGGPTTQIYVRGQLRVDTVVYLPLTDTTFTPSQKGAVIYKSSNNKLYIWNGTSWQTIPIGSTAWGTITGAVTSQTDLISYLSSTYQPITTFGYGLKKTGSNVTYDSATIRKVDTIYRLNDSTIQYVLNGRIYNVLLRGTAAGGISSLALSMPLALFNTPVNFSNSGGVWSGTATLSNQNANTAFMGPAVGSPSTPAFRSLVTADLPSNIPNSKLQNSSFDLALTTVGLTPAWASPSVSLGGTATLQVPMADATHTGFLQSTDWASFQQRMFDFGNAPGWQTGSFAGIPAAGTLLPGTHYTAVDSGFIYVDTGSGGTAGWKLISGKPSISTASITGNGTIGSPLELVGDAASPGASKYYGTNGGSVKGYYTLPSGAAGANPTALIGLTAVNGTATTFTRSDGAPALDQSIAPTWSATHTFSLPPILSGLSGYLKGNNTLAVTASSSVPTTDLSGTLQAAQFPALTGDVTTTAGSLATTLATVNGAPGTYGDASHVAQVSVNGKGLATSVGTASIQISEAQVTNLTTDLNGKLGTGLFSGEIFVGNGSNVAAAVAPAGDWTINNTGLATLSNTAVTPGSYSNANITVDSKGRLTAASNGSGGTPSLIAGHIFVGNNAGAATDTPFKNDLLTMQEINQWIAGQGLAATADSVAGYSYKQVDSLLYYYTTAGTGSEKGGWLTNSTSGDSIQIGPPICVIIGNSLAAGHTALKGRLETGGGTGGFISNYPDSAGQPSYELRAKTNMRWYNGGIGGQTTTQIRNRFLRDAIGLTINVGDGRPNATLPRKPSYIIIEGGINDFFNNIPLQTTKNNILWMVEICKEYGIPCTVMNCTGDAISNQQQLGWIKAYNDWLASGILAPYNCYVYDMNSFWNDPTYGNDNIHHISDISDDIHFTKTGYTNLITDLFNKAHLPVLDSVKFITALAPSGAIANYNRPTGITISTVPYTLANSPTVTVAVTAPILDSAWIKITSSTNVVGSSTVTGFSSIIFHVTNNPTHQVWYTKQAQFNGGFTGILNTTKLNMQGGDGNGDTTVDIRGYDAVYRVLQIPTNNGGASLVFNGNTTGAKINNATASFYNASTSGTGVGTNAGIFAGGSASQISGLQFNTNAHASSTGRGISVNNSGESDFRYECNPTSNIDDFFFTYWTGTTKAVSAASSGAISHYHYPLGWTNFSTSNQTANMALWDPTLNNASSQTNALYVGLHYKPTVTALTGATHRGLWIEQGQVVFSSANADPVMIGTTTDNSGLLQLAANTTTQSQLFLNGSSADVSSPTNGMMWYNSTTHALNVRDNGITTNLLHAGRVFSQTANGTALTNSTTATDLAGTGVGSTSIGANVLQVGDEVVTHMTVLLSTAGSPGTLNITAIGGGGGLTFTPPSSLVALTADVMARTTIITTGVSGTTATELLITIPIANVIQSVTLSGSINTTTSNNFSIQATWGTASSSNSIQSLVPTSIKID